ncbi:hypothetical protein EDD21DRAFT_162922 [Dissophora ornata]|nr:hypothetical protein EDD21DRAFT_162922 [Dissophora ornata]
MTGAMEIKVLIVGAGTAGLMLALLLELCGIEYVLLEKKPAFRPPSRACVLGAIVLPVLEQIGLLPEIEDISLPIRKFKIKRKNNIDGSVGELDASFLEQRYGYPSLVMPRPALYNVLLRRIPKHKIILGKRVLSTSQSDHGVLVRCADGTTFSGDVLVGSDGANSSVRQNLYRQLDSTTPSPPSALLLPLSVIGQATEERSRAEQGWSVMGITNPLDQERYAGLDQPFSDFMIVMGQKSKESLWCMPTANRRVLWSVAAPIEKSDKALCDVGFNASEPDQEAIEETCAKYYHFDCPYGGIMKDIFDQSPPHLRSRVLVQEKIFERWCGGRTVLIGNACHKFPPSAGLIDCINMAESVALVNRLHELRSNSPLEIRAIFEQYQEEREVYARRALHHSKKLFSFSSEKGIVAGISRKVVLSRSPTNPWIKENDLMHQDRPQVVFLPMVPQRGVFLRQDPKPSSIPIRIPKRRSTPSPSMGYRQDV